MAAAAYNVDEEADEGEKLPSVKHDIRSAKKFLQTRSSESGECLYDHLVELLEKILVERPRNAVDVFENCSVKIKNERFKVKTNYLRDVRTPSLLHEDAKKFIQLYQTVRKNGEEYDDDDGPEEAETNDDSKRAPPDIAELFFYLEQIDVGLPHSDVVGLNLSIRKLMADKPIENVRFWGKIIGKPKNYYIVEAELVADEILARRSSEAETKTMRKTEVDDNDAAEKNSEKIEKSESELLASEMDNDRLKPMETSNEKLQLIFPPMPKSVWKEAPIVPIEEIGFGANRNVYYACNRPGIDDWMELPSVTPQQITAARQIVRTCTGDPDTPIYTFPPFPGTEKNYLRAQIARISAATLVSPIGFFTFGESLDEEDEDEADTEMAGEVDETGGSAMITENRHYEPVAMKELIDPSISNWCHHRPYILPQGRTVWWNPAKDASRATDDETDVEDEEEVEEDEDGENDGTNADVDDVDAVEFPKEIGPPLLTPLSEDGSPDVIASWTARCSSSIKSDRTAIAYLRSNIWPGSFAFARAKKFGNVYIGTGQKFSPYNYSPPGMPMIQEQYKIGPELAEIRDPSFETEEAYRIAHSPVDKRRSLELDGERGELTEEEEDDDDDVDVDDDDDD